MKKYIGKIDISSTTLTVGEGQGIFAYTVPADAKKWHTTWQHLTEVYLRDGGYNDYVSSLQREQLKWIHDWAKSSEFIEASVDYKNETGEEVSPMYFYTFSDQAYKDDDPLDQYMKKANEYRLNWLKTATFDIEPPQMALVMKDKDENDYMAILDAGDKDTAEIYLEKDINGRPLRYIIELA